MANKAEIHLRYYSDEFVEQLHDFILPKEQGQFTSLPSNFLEEKEGEDRIIIHNGKEAVGFFILHTTKRVNEYTDNPNAILFTSLSINFRHQGKGYAKQAMLLLKEFVKKEFPTCDEIVLAVNHKNKAAQNLYEITGFKDTGRRKMGLIGEQYIMSLIL